MGGGDQTPNDASLTLPSVSAPSSDIHSQASPAAAAAAAEDQSIWAMLFGASTSSEEVNIHFPEYVVEDIREEAQEEAAVAKVGLPEFATAWRAEQERENPDLNVKFSYGWTLSKCAGQTERQLGCSVLKQLLEKDGYDHSHECAYGLARTCYIYGDLEVRAE